jgi:biotin carboxyl carrier protein
MATNITSEVTGKVWKLLAAPGATVAEGDTIMVIESMKMEIPVEAGRAGTLKSILVAEGDMVDEGQTVAIIE